jgi:iron complex transport system substrate-binding protein
MGTFSEPSIERILLLRPDIIFCTGLEQGPSIEKMRRLGLKVCVSDPSSISGLYDSITEIGSLVRREREASALVARMKASVASVGARTSSIPASERKRVFVEIWHSPSLTAGRGSIVDELITAAGAENVAHDVYKPYVAMGTEEIVRRDPQVIVLAYMDEDANIEAVRKRPGWGVISAVKSGRVYSDIDPDTMLRPGPRIVEGLDRLSRRVYPE